MTTTIAWTLLGLSVLAEIVGNIALKEAKGFKELLPTLLTCISYACVLLLMSAALEHLPMGSAYAVWAGSGIALTALIGILSYGEEAKPSKIFGLSLIVCGVIMLSLVSESNQISDPLDNPPSAPPSK